METPSSPLDLTPLRKLAQVIPDPVDYFTGACIPENGLPGRILCFTRRLGENLVANNLRSHHHRCVFVTALHGDGVVCVDASHVRLKEGESLLIFPFQFHSYMEIPSGDICWAFTTFETANPEDLEPLKPLRDSTRSLNTTDALLLQALLECWESESMQALLPLHLALFLRRLAAAKAPEKKPRRIVKGSGADLLARVNAYVLPRLAQPISLVELGRALGQSESHLRAQFRALTGHSLGSHLRLLRIQKACQLLHSTPLPIAAVAEQCGFDSVYSFSRAFKNVWDISPRAYRQRHLQ
jgi:AraC-like DNA-binding protein